MNLEDDLIHAFDELVHGLRELDIALNNSQPRSWTLLTPQESAYGYTHLTKVTNLYKDIWYQDGQDGRETRSCPGLVEASAEVIAKAKRVNELKDSFRNLVQKIQGKRDTWHSIKSELNHRHIGLQETMLNKGLERIHLKQLYRHIPILDHRPVKAGFSWYTGGRSIKRISVEDAVSLLLKLDSQDEHIQVQLAKVQALPANTPLARVQNQAPLMRANYVFADDVSPKRKAQNVSLPVLFPEDVNRPFPSHNIPELDPPEERNRLQRSDLKIELDPFLKSIRVHKYMAS